jgi:aryl-alcohol dehydrogenase-like predicted oxidoreductase
MSSVTVRPAGDGNVDKDEMRETKLGKTGVQVSRIAFGTWQLGGDWGPTDEDAAVSAIHRAADNGVTLFDIA